MRTLLRDLGTVSGVQCACIVRGGQVLASSFPDSDKVAQAASLGFVRGISDGLELVDRSFEEVLIDFGGKSLMVAPVEKDFVLAMLAAPDANVQLLRVVMGSSVRQLRRMHDIAEKPEPAAAPAPAQPAAKPGAGAPAAAPASAAPPQQAAGAAAPKPAAPQQPQPPPRPGTPPAPPPQAGARPQPTGRPQPPQPAKPAAPPPPPGKGQPSQPPPRPGQPSQPPPQAAAKPGAAAPAKPEPAPAPAAAKVADKDADPILPQVLALLTEYIGPVARVSFKRGVTRWRETSTPTVGTLGELAKILAADLSSDSEKKAFLDAVERLRGS